MFHAFTQTSLTSQPEVSGLVGEFVVQQGASVFVGAAAQVADVRPLV